MPGFPSGHAMYDPVQSFIAALLYSHRASGRPLKTPKMGGQPVDLFSLFIFAEEQRRDLRRVDFGLIAADMNLYTKEVSKALLCRHLKLIYTVVLLPHRHALLRSLQPPRPVLPSPARAPALPAAVPESDQPADSSAAGFACLPDDLQALILVFALDGASLADAGRLLGVCRSWRRLILASPAALRRVDVRGASVPRCAEGGNLPLLRLFASVAEHPDAIAALAFCHVMGWNGAPRDLAEASRLCARAASLGQRDASRMLQSLRPFLELPPSGAPEL
eukprot:tig00020909_g15344.t1